MFQMFKIYYREHGVQRIDQLISVSEFKLRDFPRDSLFHVLDESDDPNVDTSKEYFKGYQKKILIEQIEQYVKTEGQVRVKAYNLNALTQPFRQQNRQHWMQAPEPYRSERNGLTLIVMNYGYLDWIHKYQPVVMAPYHRWLNRQRTVYSQMLKIAETCDRNQFMFYPVPSLIQGKTLLDKYAKMDISTQMVNVLGQAGEAGFMQLDLWMWLNPETRERSLINIIPPQHYPKINLVFKGSTGKECLINLGFLNSWIKGQPNQTFFSSISQYDPLFVQKLFLKLNMALNAVIGTDEAVDMGAGQASKVTEPVDDGVMPVSHLVHSETGDTDSPESDEEIDDESTETDGLSEVKGLTSSASKDTTSKPEPLKDIKPKSLPISTLTSNMMSEIEADIQVLDHLNMVQLKNTGLSFTSEVEEPVAKVVKIDPEVVKQTVFGQKTPEDRLLNRLKSDAESNLITAAEYRKMTQQVEAYRESADPYGSKQTRAKAMVIVPEDLVLSKEKVTVPTSDSVPDKTMASSTLIEYDRQYIKNVLRKDVLQAIDGLQAAGVVVRNHEVDITRTILGTYENHVLELKPIDGAPSSIKFTLPVVDEDGTFLAGGNKYLMRKQRVDVSLRKIGPRIAGLSTYYGKTMVQINPKVTNDPLSWIYRKINLASVTPGAYIHEVSPGDVYDNYFDAPYFFGALAKEYSQFKAGDNTLIFDLEYRKKINPDLLKIVEHNGRVWCGWTKEQHPIVIDRNSHFFEVYKDSETALGNVYDLLHLEQADAPVDFTEVRVFSKFIPVGVVLGYYLGFSALLILLGATYRSVAPRKNKELQKDEFAIVFKDETCVFKTDNRIASLILAGFLDFDKVTKLYEKAEFENKAVYLNLLMSKKITSIYIRELDMLETCYVDPISREILERMNLPTTYAGLLLKATELLQTFTHPDSQDRNVMRERGYERFAGVVYKEIMQSIRGFRNRNLVGRSKIDMSPYQVWNAIMKDSSIKIAEDTNPIQNLKEKEVMTYSGMGGRDRDTMTKSTRSAHPSDHGLLSESTVDSSAVGTIAYLSANPNLGDVRGMMKKEKELNPTSILSTSALLSPASTNDNPKRIMFIATQHSHTIASPGYRQPYLRTGYEFIIGKRTSKMFSTAAAEDGAVTDIKPKGLIVTYTSGEVVGIELGRVYGRAEGTVYPNDIVSTLKPGDKFKRGDILAYNSKFFEPDFLNPKEPVLMMNHSVTTALLESKQTHEDSCTISQRLGQEFKTEVTKIKSFVVKFAQNLSYVRKPGEEVNPKDVLMIIEDEITSNVGNFSDDALSTLKRLSNVAPKAGVLGTVERIEVFYNGDKQDMSATLRKLADTSDLDFARTARATNQPVLTGRVSEEYRVSGTPLEMDQAEVRIYITVKANTGVGDKAVFGHQMKCTVSEVMKGEMRTEDGEVIDATFSYRSVAARGVLSAAIIGTTISLLDHIGKKAASMYLGEDE